MNSSERGQRASHRFLALWLAACAAGVAVTAAPAVRADDAETSVLAAQLFKDGRSDMALEDWRAAEAKFAASHKLVPAMGTLLNLAVCQARLGKTASAYHAFTEVAREAEHSGRKDRLDLATAEMAKIKPLLADAIIHVQPDVQGLPGFTLTIDGSPLPAPLFETRVNLDPGDHTLLATATNKKPWEYPLHIAPSEHTEATVPFLADRPFDPNEVKVRQVDADRAAKHQTIRTAGFVVGGIGVAGVITSLVFGALAKAQMNKVHCSSNATCTSAEAHDSQTANTDATVANVVFGTGLGLVATGGVLLFVARDSGPASDKGKDKDDPDEEDARLRWKLSPAFDARGGGLSVGRAF